MRVMIQCIHEGNYRNLAFPCQEKELQILCDSFEIVNTAETETTIGTVHNDERLAVLLTGKTVNLDELNYLMKRLDSFDDGEMNTFCAAAEGLKLSTLKDMINLTFNTNCYSLVDDFSDLNRLGKNLYLNSVGSVTSEELRNFDGKAYVQKMMEENLQPIVTPYGLIYENGNQPQQLYQGRTFPAYWYEPNPITLSIHTEKDVEYLYLPVEKSELSKALERLGVDSLSEVRIETEEHVLPTNIAEIVFQGATEFDTLNEYATIFKEMGIREVSALSDFVDFAKITTATELKTLTQCMYEFESFPGVHTAEQYGRHMICESGHFEYDENLEGYINFEAYGKDKINRETGAFTKKGYLLYHGYNMEMQSILQKNLGMKMKEQPEPQELKLYMPLKATTYYDENNYGDLYQVDFEIEVYPDELGCYEDEIHAAIQERRLEEEKRGMMDYYGEHDSVNAKVQRYLFDVEIVNGNLMGVATLTLNAPLNQAELEKIKETIEGQCSDGFGEGFEQQEIDCNGKEIYVSLWGAKDWCLRTAEEMGITEQKRDMQIGGM